MTHLHALFLGILEGITEFLPVSSTGHLILAGKLFQLPETEFLKSFDIAIQLGAILAVVGIYWRRFMLETATMKRIAAAFVPTGIIGFALHSMVKRVFLGNERIVLWSLLIGGMALIVFELLHHEDEHDSSDIASITYAQAIGVGLFQSIALIPGVSRSAATIIGGMLLGVKRRTIVEFSFLLAVPTMAAATGLDLLKTASSFSVEQVSMLAVGFAASCAAAFFSIRWLLKFVQRRSLIPFGIYRIAVALFMFVRF